jgi:hypothetical protein
MFETNTLAGASGDYPAVYRSLMLIGLLGGIYRAGDDVQIVNTAVEATLDDPTVYTMYHAIAMGMGGNSDFAKKSIGAHIDRHSDDDGAKVVMAVSMMLSGDPNWKQWIDNVLASSTDQNARTAANGVLSYLASVAQAH